jgi:hypothetical protein
MKEVSKEKMDKFNEDLETHVKYAREFIITNIYNFMQGWNTSHMMSYYNTFCTRKGYVPIPSGAPKGYLGTLLRHFCVTTNVRKHEKRTSYFLVNSEGGKELVNSYGEFMKGREARNVLYDHYVKAHPEGLILSRESFHLLHAGQSPTPIETE